MNIETISKSIEAIDDEASKVQKEVRLNFLYEHEDFLILQGTQKGLIKFALEIMKFAISPDLKTQQNNNYNFGSLFEKQSEFHLLDIEKVEGFDKAVKYQEKRFKLKEIGVYLIAVFLLTALVVGVVTIIGYLNK